MGFIRDVKASTIGNEAAKAYAAGDWYFTPLLNFPQTKPNMSGNIADWGMMITAIVNAGWTLQHWAIGQDAKGRPEAYPVFLRRT